MKKQVCAVVFLYRKDAVIELTKQSYSVERFSAYYLSFISLYLMNFMFHTTLNAASDVLRVHYKSMKCDVSFSQGIGYVRYLGDGTYFILCKNFPAYNSRKLFLKSIEIFQRHDHKMHCHLLWFTV